MTLQNYHPTDQFKALEHPVVGMLETDRLEIHAHTVKRPGCTGGADRTVYHAWLKMDATGEDVAKPIVVITIGWRGMVEWIHTDEQFRRRGFGTEAMKAVEDSLKGQICIDGATDAGDAFCDHYEKLYPSCPFG